MKRNIWIKIEDFQLIELQQEKLFINKYDLDLKYDYELKSQWKEFFFDILSELMTKTEEFSVTGANSKEELFNYLKNNYKSIINNYNLKIDKRDYIDIEDYISLKEWEKENPNNRVLFTENDGFILLTSIGA